MFAAQLVPLGKYWASDISQMSKSLFFQVENEGGACIDIAGVANSILARQRFIADRAGMISPVTTNCSSITRRIRFRGSLPSDEFHIAARIGNWQHSMESPSSARLYVEGAP